MAFNENWSYTQSINWPEKYNQATGKQQSPINIDTNKTSDCNLLCQIAMKYSKSGCYARVKNRTPIITFDSGSFIKFTKTKEAFALQQMTIHTPSLHKFNDTQYDMEVILYHKLMGSLDPKSPGYIPGGTAISILFQKGIDYGKQNTFFNSFINKLPTSENDIEIDIDVGDAWGPELIIPETKSYYFYPGSLPFPPCEEDWKWIVFEEVQGVSSSIINALETVFANNIRPVMELNGRVPAYNSNVNMEIDNELEKIVAKELELKKPVATKKNTANDDLPVNRLQNTEVWYKTHKLYIKGIIISICLLLIIFGALRMVKYIINEDILNIIMVRQALGNARQKKLN